MNNGPAAAQFRQAQTTRGFNQQLQNVVPGHGNFTYPMPTLATGNTQQLYDMIIPQDPAIARVQGQPFRPTHQHSASDPASLREATLQLLTNNLPQFPQPGMYPTLGGPAALSMFNQFFQPDNYAQGDLAAAQLMARQLQSQYTGTFGSPANNSGMTSPASTVAQNSTPSGNGPSANNRKLGLYKTELCRSWEEKGTCRYGSKCQFAHGEEELRKVPRHPKYKTEICRVRLVLPSLVTAAQHSSRLSGSPDLAPTANGVASSIPKSPLVEEQAPRVLPRPLNPLDAIVRRAPTATLTTLLEALFSPASPPSVIGMPTPLEASTRLPLHPPPPEDLQWVL